MNCQGVSKGSLWDYTYNLEITLSLALLIVRSDKVTWSSLKGVLKQGAF